MIRKKIVLSIFCKANDKMSNISNEVIILFDTRVYYFNGNTYYNIKFRIN
jgi:hypothetical protein